MCKNLELFTRKVFSTSKPDFSHQLHRGEKEADVKVYQTSNLHYYSKKNVQQDKLNAYTPPKTSELGDIRNFLYNVATLKRHTTDQSRFVDR